MVRRSQNLTTGQPALYNTGATGLRGGRWMLFALFVAAIAALCVFTIVASAPKRHPASGVSSRPRAAAQATATIMSTLSMDAHGSEGFAVVAGAFRADVPAVVQGGGVTMAGTRVASRAPHSERWRPP